VVAFVLTLVCPGLGSAYLGNVLKGTLICLLFIAGAGAFVAFVTAFKFFPGLALVVFFASWASFSLLLAFDAAAEAGRLGDEYVIGGGNHIVIYTLMALGTYFLPLTALYQYTDARLWTLVEIADDGMYPTLLPGDVVLVDRTAYLRETPVAGEVVAVRIEGLDRPRLARIIGIPGDRVEVVDSVPWVNGDPLPRVPVGISGRDHPAVLALVDAVPPPTGALAATELNRGVEYLTADALGGAGSIFEAVLLGAHEFYTLRDNRLYRGDDGFADSRDYGALWLGAIIGRPLYIAYSSESGGECRWERVARRVQPQHL